MAPGALRGCHNCDSPCLTQGATKLGWIHPAQYEKLIQSVFREVVNALAGREMLARQLQTTPSQLQSEPTRLRLTNSNSISIGSVATSPCLAPALSAASRLSSYRSENGITCVWKTEQRANWNHWTRSALCLACNKRWCKLAWLTGRTRWCCSRRWAEDR